MVESSESSKLVYLGTYIIILFISSLISNITLIWIYLKNRQYLNNIHLLKLTLAIINTIGTVISLPLVALRALSSK